VPRLDQREDSMDEDTTANVEAFWEKASAQGDGYTIPSLDLSRQSAQRYAAAELHARPASVSIRVRSCTASRASACCAWRRRRATDGGIRLLGAEVTVSDLSESQLEPDRAAAHQFGYELRSEAGDMRDPKIAGRASEADANVAVPLVASAAATRRCLRISYEAAIAGIGNGSSASPHH
jgi:hypothetical protein